MAADKTEATPANERLASESFNPTEWLTHINSVMDADMQGKERISLACIDNVIDGAKSGDEADRRIMLITGFSALLGRRKDMNPVDAENVHNALTRLVGESDTSWITGN